VWKLLKARETENPFHGEVEALRRVNWVKRNWLRKSNSPTDGWHCGGKPKLRVPVFLGLRDDKEPEECLLENHEAEAVAAVSPKP